MTATILDLIGDMKNCLALALGTGLISGYLYTKLRAREIYKPDIKNLKNKIKLNEGKSIDLLEKNENIKSDLSLHNKKIDKSNLEITQHKQEILEHEMKLKKLQLDGSSVVNNYQIEKNKLDRYNKEVDELKTTLDIDDVSNIEKSKELIKDKSLNITEKYSEKKNMVDAFTNEVTALKKENSNLTYEIDSKKALLNKKDIELKDTHKKLSSIRGELQENYEKLLKTRDDNLSQIEKYKKQLVDLKSKLS